MEYSTRLTRAMEKSMNSPFGHTGYNNENTTHERALFWRPWAQGPLEQRTDSHEVSLHAHESTFDPLNMRDTLTN